jgi:hypothetical protein
MRQKNLKEKFIVLKTIMSESFLEKFILLLLTAFLSGLIIPYVTTEIQRNKARNDIVLQAQNRLLEDVSRTLLIYETLLLDVSWFKTPSGNNEQMHQKAFERYQERAVDLLSEWRVESVKAKTLVSIEMSEKLDSFQVKMFRLQDTPMNKLYREKGSVSEWQELHKTNAGMLDEANTLIANLAIEMKITQSSIK